MGAHDHKQRLARVFMGRLITSGTCLLRAYILFAILVWFGLVLLGLNIFYSEDNDWARHTKQQCPSPEWCLVLFSDT